MQPRIGFEQVHQVQHVFQGTLTLKRPADFLSAKQAPVADGHAGELRFLQIRLLNPFREDVGHFGLRLNHARAEGFRRGRLHLRFSVHKGSARFLQRNQLCLILLNLIINLVQRANDQPAHEQSSHQQAGNAKSQKGEQFCPFVHECFKRLVTVAGTVSSRLA